MLTLSNPVQLVPREYHAGNTPYQTSLHLLLGPQDQWLEEEQDQLPCSCRSTGTASCNCQETETCMVWACAVPQQPLKTILQGILEGEQCCGQQRKCWMDIKKWTSLPMPQLFTRASCRKVFSRISAESSLMFPRPLPKPNGKETELNWSSRRVSLTWAFACKEG